MNNEQRDYCKKHISLYINPKYGKCSKCRIEDGDIVTCKVCEDNMHDKKYVMCWDCMNKQNQGGEK